MCGGAWGPGWADGQDVVQEALVRTIAADGLEPISVAPYAMTVAKNLLARGLRQAELHRRKAPLLLDLTAPEQPDDALATRELSAMVRAVPGNAAPRGAPGPHRSYRRPAQHTAELAADSGSTAGAVGALLARARARGRMEYAVADTGTCLSDPRCRQVLLAIAAHDRRRQVALDTTAHVIRCPRCAGLAPIGGAD